MASLTRKRILISKKKYKLGVTSEKLRETVEQPKKKREENKGKENGTNTLEQHLIATSTKDLDETFLANCKLNIATLHRGQSAKLQLVSLFLQDIIDTYSDIPSFSKEVMEASLVGENVGELYNTFFQEKSNIINKDQFLTPERAMAYKWLLEDIEKSVKVFLRMTRQIRKTKKIKFTFKGVNENGCELFHRDYVPIRMLICYLGPSTEWVPNSEVDWHYLKNPKSSILNEKLIKNYPAPIRHIPTNDLLVMKVTIGVLRANKAAKPHKACIHRSPEITTSGQVRVVLQFDV